MTCDLKGLRVGGEEVEVVRDAMPEMELGERGASCQEETALAGEEGVEDETLQRRQLREGRRSSSHR